MLWHGVNFKDNLMGKKCILWGEKYVTHNEENLGKIGLTHDNDISKRKSE